MPPPGWVAKPGYDHLARFCLDVNRSEKARNYLAELGREDAIPAEALDPDFRAKAEFSQWLAHPNELGRAPDDLEIIEKRIAGLASGARAQDALADQVSSPGSRPGSRTTIWA